MKKNPIVKAFFICLFDLKRLRCLLVLRERKAWISLNYDRPVRHCLYWNLDEWHPVMVLNKRINEEPCQNRGGREEKPGMEGKSAGSNSS